MTICQLLFVVAFVVELVLNIRADGLRPDYGYMGGLENECTKNRKFICWGGRSKTRPPLSYEVVVHDGARHDLRLDIHVAIVVCVAIIQ